MSLNKSNNKCRYPCVCLYVVSATWGEKLMTYATHASFQFEDVVQALNYESNYREPHHEVPH